MSNMEELAIKRAKEYLKNHPSTQSQDKEIFIDAFSKGFKAGFDELAELINLMWSPNNNNNK